MGETDFPEPWTQTKFDEYGYANTNPDEEGEALWTLDVSRPLEKVVRGIADEPESLDISSGRAPDEALLADAEVLHVMEPYNPALLEPYLPALRSVL